MTAGENTDEDQVESVIEQQQETIERQRERIEALQEQDADHDTDGGEEHDGGVLSRRSALKASGLLALLGVGTGTVSADPQGQVGTADNTLQSLYTDELYGNGGSITVQDTLDLNGGNLASRSAGSEFLLDVDSAATNEDKRFLVQLNDTENTASTIEWRRMAAAEVAFRVHDRTNDTDLLSVNDTGDVDVHNGSLDLNSNTVTNVSSIDGGGSSISVDDTLEINGNNVSGLNSLTDTGDNTHLTLNSGGNLGINRTLDATGVKTLLRNGSGTSLPGTSTDGEIRLYDDTDARDPGGRIQFQANGTTFTVNADAGDTYRDEIGFAEAMGQEPIGPDETRCPETGEPFEVSDPIVHQVDQRSDRDDWDEIHAVPMSLDAALDDSETVSDHEARIDGLEAELAAKDARIEDQRDRIDALESEAASLREENDTLRERVAAIEAELGLDATADAGVADD